MPTIQLTSCAKISRVHWDLLLSVFLKIVQCQSRLLEQQIGVKIINTKSLIVCELWYQFPMFICTNCLEQITLAYTLFSLDFKFSTGNQNFLEWISSIVFRLENFGRENLGRKYRMHQWIRILCFLISGIWS